MEASVLVTLTWWRPDGAQHWWVRAAHWLFHDHLWHWWHIWHYTEGWGSFGTIFVAVLAIVVSARFNRRTLRQARVTGEDTVEVMRQQRADQRNDVLRTELAQWLTLVSEVERACGELLRSAQNMNLQEEDGNSPLVEVVEVGRRVGAFKSAVSHVISEPLTNFATQGTQIQMLTADDTILGNVHLITQAIVGKVQNLNALIETRNSHAKRTPDQQQQEHENFLFSVVLAIGQDIQYTRQITASRGDLINYVIRHFNPAALGTMARVNRKFPNVLQHLQPTSIFRPPPLSTETQPPDTDEPPAGTQ